MGNRRSRDLSQFCNCGSQATVAKGLARPVITLPARLSGGSSLAGL